MWLFVKAEENASDTSTIGSVIPALGAGIHAFLSRVTKGVDPATKSRDDGALVEATSP